MNFSFFIRQLLALLDRARVAAIGFAGNLNFYLGLTAFFIIIFDFGFPHSSYTISQLDIFYAFCLKAFFYLSVLVFLLSLTSRWRPAAFFSSLLLILLLALTVAANYYFPEWVETKVPFLFFLQSKYVIYFTIALVFFSELGKRSLKVHTMNIHPARLFIYGFLFLILAGTCLLLLPNSTVNGISLMDALFTSTSAVCVTGLVVVDTATHFTAFGKTIILILIQAGGLGIMAFTSFFGFFFTGGSSFRDQLYMKDFVNTEKMGEVFTLVVRIILLTFSIEAIGAALIYYQIPSELFSDSSEKWKFSVFHSISAFCNAGFSTLSQGMFDVNYRFNYSLHLVIAVLIILGGLGFPIVFNYFSVWKHYIKSSFRMIFLGRSFEHTPRLVNVNTRLVVRTTLILLGAGTLLVFAFEAQNSFSDKSFIDTLVASFFCATTVRTAGFNTVDFSALTHGSILFLLFLMWAGASPCSTGGGIKTTTLAVAVLNALSISRGKDRVEVFRRELSQLSVRRAHAILFLSILVIGSGFFLLSIFEPEKDFLPILFESVSAFSTVGLSLNVTGNLSDAGKITVMLLMFIGRVGTLTILIAFIKKITTLHYRYPKESIFIN